MPEIKDSQKRFEFITVNVKPVVRNDVMEGRDWIVAPMIEITEGVHNGSDGPIFYSAAELSKGLATWNHRPVVVYHPRGGSASTPTELTARKIGVTMSTTFNDAKVKAEAWLDPERIAAVDNRVAEAIAKNETMELSTGLYMELDRVKGVWNGESYIGSAKNLSLDHLALLPDLKGACSIEDGAGFLRLNEMSHGNVRSLLSSALREMNESAWIEEVYDNFFIFEDTGKLYQQSYMENDVGISISADKVEVKRVVEYRKVSDDAFVGNENDINLVKGSEMDKTKVVEALIANERTPWKATDKETLLAMDEVALEQLTNAGKEPEVKEVIKEVPAAVVNVEKVVTANTEKVVVKELTADEYIANAPAAVREVLNASMAMLKQERAQMIATIKQNDRNAFSDVFLNEMAMEDLAALARLAAPIENGQPVVPASRFSGQAPVIENAVMPEPLPMPKWEG